MREAEGCGDLVVGGARRVGDRCIIPVVRTLAVCRGETAVVGLTPVALLFAEGDDEYVALLPGAPLSIGDALGPLREDIEREKKKCGDSHS
ncbi:hypothetical protein [Methanoculleus sp. 7T]|uniref:hypothetical protein n=1 Tax=Methanoculleus sp. 7T TaxID=2937282 RepID=UPI0020C142C7|nr:hypothetical protein [Methanoculleus sp. 7T]MCK8518471.1 hypothetical protein [Methanoculleus sp. 7T]